MLLIVVTLTRSLSRRASVHTPTLVSKQAWVTSLRPALIGLGIRGRALERLEVQQLESGPASEVDAATRGSADRTVETLGPRGARYASRIARTPAASLALAT